jgi:CRISPR-associated protein Csx17
LLAGGQSTRAFSIMLRRLEASGLRAPLVAVALDDRIARRFAASLAFPISSKTAAGFARLLDHPSTEEELSHVG